MSTVSPQFPRGLSDDDLARTLDTMSAESVIVTAQIDFSTLLPELQRALINEGALEQSRRQSDKLARIAIYVSVAAILVSTALAVVTAAMS